MPAFVYDKDRTYRLWKDPLGRRVIGNFKSTWTICALGTCEKLLVRRAAYQCAFDSCYFGLMLDNFSTRARQIVFAARFKAGERGANMIDTDDFLVGLVLEDQGMLAEDLLANLNKKLPQLPPLALTAEVPLSPSLERVFNSAKAVQTRFHHSQVEPLHFLAAIFKEEASQGVKLLQASGITSEKVLRTLAATEN